MVSLLVQVGMNYWSKCLLVDIRMSHPALMPSYKPTNYVIMMSSNGNIVSVTDPFWGNSPDNGEFPSQRPVTRSFVGLLLNKRLSSWVNNREAGDLRRHYAHYDVTAIVYPQWFCSMRCKQCGCIFFSWRTIRFCLHYHVALVFAFNYLLHSST